MKLSELLDGMEMVSVTKARNLDCIGWKDGYLLVKFYGRPDRWIYGPNIPEAEKDKILRVPFPDKLFSTNIRNRYKSYKIGS